MAWEGMGMCVSISGGGEKGQGGREVPLRVCVLVSVYFVSILLLCFLFGCLYDGGQNKQLQHRTSSPLRSSPLGHPQEGLRRKALVWKSRREMQRKRREFCGEVACCNRRTTASYGARVV